MSPPQGKVDFHTLNNLFCLLIIYFIDLMSFNDHSTRLYVTGSSKGHKEVELILEWDAALLAYFTLVIKP